MLLLAILLTNCKKDQVPEPTVEAPVLAISWDDDLDPPSGSGPTLLGEELNNPYDLATMNQAYELLTGQAGQLEATHYYLRLLPTSGEQVMAIADYEDEYGYEFETQPIHYRVTYQGDEDYRDPNLGDDEFSPEYGAIEARQYEMGNLPEGVAYEVIQAMQIPDYETRLAFTAFVISDNERYYEALEGLCHPDCPTWPACLDDADLTCISLPEPDGEVKAITTTDPFADEDRVNFPQYIMDAKLGYFGEKDFLPKEMYENTRAGDLPHQGDPPVANFDEVPDCGPNCTAVLLNVDDPFPDWEWTCDCDPVDPPPPGGSNDPPAGEVERCDCFVYEDDRKPGGRIMVEDTQLPDPEGVRRIKVKTTKHYWGFIWRNTDTDDNGCWKINHRYNVRRTKTKIVFKDRVSDRITIRAVMTIPVNTTHEMDFLNLWKPVKQTWYLREDSRVWNDQCLLIWDPPVNMNGQERSFVAATTNNAYHEFFDDHSTLPHPNGRVRILLQTVSDDWKAAPMLHRMSADQAQAPEVTGWLAAYIASPLTTGLIHAVDQALPDMVLPFGEFWASDDLKALVYHETTHVSQYSRLGAAWWGDYVQYIVTVAVEDALSPPGFGQADPYGNGDLPGASLAELAEGHANSVEHYMADLQYGLDHSRGGDRERRRYMNVAEELLFWEDPELPVGSTFIPEGLFFDLFDGDGIPLPITEDEPDGIIDNVSGFTFEQQLDAFHPGITSISLFQARLFELHGVSNGVSLTNYNNLFTAYGQ